jgi:hypothetical protein
LGFVSFYIYIYVYNQGVIVIIKMIVLAALMGISSATIAAESMTMPEAGAAGGRHGHGGMGGEMRRESSAAWTTFPILQPKTRGNSRAERMTFISMQNIAADHLEDYSNNLKDENGGLRQLAVGMAGVKLEQPASGGFHLLSAREDLGEVLKVASTVHYYGGERAIDPTAMFMQVKNELEIIPQPYPREHSRYRANEDWKFLVRFKGVPLGNQKLFLETSNGTKAEVLTDAQGVLSLHVPDDFKAEESTAEGMPTQGRRGADFVLVVERAEAGMTYLTAFNSAYAPNAFDKRSLALGLGFTLLGMLGGLPLLRGRKSLKKSAEPVANEPKAEA